MPDLSEPPVTDAVGQDPRRRGEPLRQVPPYAPHRDGGWLPHRRPGRRRAPVLQLLLYYVLLVGIAALLIRFVPLVRDALVAHVLPHAVGEAQAVLQGRAPAAGGAITAPALADWQIINRGFSTLLIIAATLTLVAPVAAIYVFSKRLQYDPALVRSVIILPIVVTGIALVVKNSLALAFSLAGIAGAVRFRNTLKDPRDAVYIFLAIGIGLAAGVQALDIALVMSLAFNFVVLFLWRYQIGSVYGGRYARTGILSLGDPGLLVAQTPEARGALRRRLVEQVEPGEEPDGILLLHTTEAELARQMVPDALDDTARDWRLVSIVPRAEGVSTLEYLVTLKKDTPPTELLGAVEERWATQLAGAEYVPFRLRQKERSA